MSFMVHEIGIKTTYLGHFLGLRVCTKKTIVFLNNPLGYLVFVVIFRCVGVINCSKLMSTARSGEGKKLKE